MRTVFLKPRFEGMPVHALFNSIKKNPPEGYNIIGTSAETVHKFATLGSKNRSPFFKTFMHYTYSLPYILWQLQNSMKIPNNVELVWAVSHIANIQKRWITSVESVDALSAYFNIDFVKPLIKKKLKEKNCKKILAFSEWARGTIINCFDDNDIKNKIVVIRYTVEPKNIQKEKTSDKIRILFVGTNNPGTQKNFEHKGVYEIVNSFFELQKKYGNKIELILRTKIPKELRSKVRSNNCIRLYENILSLSEMENLYITSDIFPHVGYETANLSILEAMSYGLPVIGLDIYNTSEIIVNKKNGFLILPRKKEPLYTKYNLPNSFSHSFLSEMRNSREYISKKLTETLEKLILDEKLRITIGKNARDMIDSGNMSIAKRNLALKKIFDDSLENQG